MELDVCRKNDIIVTPGGRKIYPSYFVHLLDGIDGIQQFQFVQTGHGDIVLRLSARQEVVSIVEAALTSRLQADLGGDMSLQEQRDKNIPRSRSGKHRFVIGMHD